MTKEQNATDDGQGQRRKTLAWSVLSTLVYSTAKYWFAEFRRIRMSTNAVPRIGGPQDTVTPDNIAKSHLKMKLIELINIIGIANECEGHIIHEFVQMRKICARCGLSLLFHQNNAPTNSICDTTDNLKELRYELVTYPTCSRDLAHSDLETEFGMSLK